MLTADGLALLGLSGVLGSMAMLVKVNAFRMRTLFLCMAALSFGTALGMRAALAECAYPLPSTLRFVAMATFATFAFHRSWSWVRQTLTS